MTKGGTLTEVLTEAKGQYGNRTIRGFETVVYHPLIDGNVQRSREFIKFEALPLPQAVCFFPHTVPDFDSGDYSPRILRRDGTVKIFFQLVSLSFLSGDEAIEIFTTNFYGSLERLNERNDSACIDLIFRACALSSIKCTASSENKVFVKMEFNDLESLKLHWRDSLILT